MTLPRNTSTDIDTMNHLKTKPKEPAVGIADNPINSESDDYGVDRNFDPITDHFVKKVYGGLKGDIRLAVLRRDLKQVVNDLSHTLGRPLKVLDIGAGLAQMSIELAQQGHNVTVNDISNNMLLEAKKSADNLGVIEDIRWIACPYQELEARLSQESDDVLIEEDEQTNGSGYDLVLCHALLEWLGRPSEIMPFFAKWLSKHGVLSLCFYYPASFVYRNLVMGNFNLLNNPNFRSDNNKSLTPNNPVSYEEVEGWLTKQGFDVGKVSGLRVFHDYTPLKRGGNTNPDAVIEMELRYSTQTPYKWLGRYLHVMATR